jgi:hypothetical protein
LCRDRRPRDEFALARLVGGLSLDSFSDGKVEHTGVTLAVAAPR